MTSEKPLSPGHARVAATFDVPFSGCLKLHKSVWDGVHGLVNALGGCNLGLMLSSHPKKAAADDVPPGAAAIGVPATGLKELKVNRGRVAIAFEFPDMPSFEPYPVEKISQEQVSDMARNVGEALGGVEFSKAIFPGAYPVGDPSKPIEWPTVVSGTFIPVGAGVLEPVWGTRRDGDWNHDSLADLIRENTEHDGTCAIQVGTIVWRGLKKFDDPADFVPGADDIINTMANNAASSDGGEFADDYPNVTEEAQAELNEYLIAWARKHAPVTGFYGVVDIELYTVTSDDLESAKTAH